MTTYSAPVEEMMFLYNHLKDNKDYNEIQKFKEINSDLVKDILDQAAKINQEIVHPLAKVGDETPCVYENGVVRSSHINKRINSLLKMGGHHYHVIQNMVGQGMPKTVSIF